MARYAWPGRRLGTDTKLCEILPDPAKPKTGLPARPEWPGWGGGRWDGQPAVL